LAIMDGMDEAPGLNPAWKPARDAYAGPVQNRQALELGEKMAGADAKDFLPRLSGMSDGQQEFFRLGHRSGLAQDLKSLPDFGDAATRLSGTFGKREALEAAHGPEASQALLERLGAEQDASRTWDAVKGAAGTTTEDAVHADQLAQASKGIIQ